MKKCDFDFILYKEKTIKLRLLIIFYCFKKH